jgi:hypothetical protein
VVALLSHAVAWLFQLQELPLARSTRRVSGGLLLIIGLLVPSSLVVGALW